MNFGTKLRTALYIITMVNQVNVSIGIWEFGNETVNLVYKIFSYLLTLVAGAAALWFNNDFTPEAAQGTALTRYLKDMQREDYIGEDFFSRDVAEEEDEPDDI